MNKTQQIRKLYIELMNEAWTLNNNDDYTGKGDNPEIDLTMDILSLLETELDIFTKLQKLEDFIDGSA